jgi:integrase
LNVRIKYLKQETDRHGKPRLYVRLPGQKLIRLPVNTIKDPQFGPAYAAALNGEPVPSPAPKQPTKREKAPTGSLRALCDRYFDYFTKDTTLAERTKYVRRRNLENVCREMVKSPSGMRPAADIPVKIMTRAHVSQLLDRNRATPEASNDRRKALMALFKWAIPRGYADKNPVTETRPIKTKTGGFTTWKREHVERYAETHPFGTKEYLALALFLFTGQRRSDVITFGPKHVENGVLHFAQQKTRKEMHIPIHAGLQEVLDLVPSEQPTFLVTEFGKPFAAGGFSHWFHDRCVDAGLRGFSCHGLRKALQTFGANAGLSAHELQALAGHSSLKETSRYTEQRDSALLADSGMTKLSGLRIGAPKIDPPKSAPKKPKK